MSPHQINRDTIYLTAEELIKRWRFKVSAGTLRNWRSSKQGPSFVKQCRIPLYPIEAVVEYERCQKMN